MWKFLDHTELNTHTHAVGLLRTSDQLFAGRFMHNTHKIQESNALSSAGFVPTIPAIQWLQNYALDCKIAGISRLNL